MVEHLKEAARTYYTEDLDYHNFSHIRLVLESAEEIMERCRKHDIDIEEDIVRVAIYFHDAGYHEDHRELGYGSKEDYSKNIARQELEDRSYPERFISRVESCIEATKPSSDPTRNEEILVRASDLRGLMGDYSTFRENSIALREESKKIDGRKPDETEWVQGVLDTLLHYAGQDLELTPEHETEEGLSEFHARLGRNIGQFMHDFVDSDMELSVRVDER